MGEPNDNVTAPPTDEEMVRVWIVAMHKACGLGAPTSTAAAAAPASDDGLPDGPARSDSEAKGLEHARAALAERLEALSLPPRLPKGEAEALLAQVDIIRRVLAAALSVDDLSETDAALAGAESTARALAATMDTRLARVAELGLALDALAAPDAGFLDPAEMPDIEGARAAIVGGISGDLAEETLAAADRSIAELALRLETTRKTTTERAERARAVQARYLSLIRPVGGTEADYAALDADVPAIRALDAPPAGEAKVAAAEAALARMTVEAERLAALFAGRAERARAAAAALARIDLAGIDAAAGLAEILAEQAAIKQAMAVALDDAALASAEVRVAALTRQAAAALERRAATMVVALDTLVLPPGLPADEGEAISEKMDTIRKAATPPLAGDRLAGAAQTLAVLPDALASLAKTLDERRARIAKAASDAAKVADPDHATVAEKADLKTLREDPSLKPPSSLTETAAAAAESAAKALADRHAELVATIKTREDKRAEVVAQLLTLVPPVSATGAEAVKVLKAGSALRTKVEKAATLQEIEAEAGAIHVLEMQVAEIAAVAAARNKAVQALAVAEALVKTEQPDLFSGGYLAAAKMLVGARRAIDAGKTAADFTKAEAEIAKVGPYLTSVKGYLKDLQEWRAEAELYIRYLPLKSTKTGQAKKDEETSFRARKVAVQQKLFDLQSKADALAGQSKLPEAKAELAKFKTGAVPYTDHAGATQQATYTAVTDTAALAFPGYIKTFMANKFSIMKDASKLKVMKNAALNAALGAIRSKGYNDQKWTEAKNELDALSVKLDACKVFITAYEEVQAVVENTADATMTATFTLIETDCKNKDFAAAKAKVDALTTSGGPVTKDFAAFQKALVALQARVTAVTSDLTGSAATAAASVVTPWAKAQTESDQTKRMKLLADVGTELTLVEDLVAARATALAALGKLDSSGTYKILASADALCAAGKVTDAEAAYNTAAAEARKLATYLALAERAKAVRAAYPATALAELKQFDDALAEAEANAVAQKLEAAKDVLSILLATPSVAVEDKAFTLYDAQYKATKARHDKLVAATKEPAALARLTAPWTAIETAGQVDRKYLDAVDLMEKHAVVLAEAKTYVDAELRAKRATAALEKVAARASPAQIAQIYPSTADKATLDKMLANAAALAAGGNFAAATKAYDDLVALAKTGMGEAAKALEAMDDGHFLAAHGPDVPIKKTLERMTTGIRPDGEVAPAAKSSQWQDIGDFLACYDLALEKAKAAKGFFNNIPAGSSGPVLAASDPAQVQITFDAGKAIGLGVEGLSRQMGFDESKGERGETDLFETFEVTEGLQSVQAKFIFHFKHPDSTSTAVLTNHNDYVKAYKSKHGATSTPVYPCEGHWALNQLLPTFG